MRACAPARAPTHAPTHAHTHTHTRLHTHTHTHTHTLPPRRMPWVGTVIVQYLMLIPTWWQHCCCVLVVCLQQYDLLFCLRCVCVFIVLSMRWSAMSMVTHARTHTVSKKPWIGTVIAVSWEDPRPATGVGSQHTQFYLTQNTTHYETWEFSSSRKSDYVFFVCTDSPDYPPTPIHTHAYSAHTCTIQWDSLGGHCIELQWLTLHTVGHAWTYTTQINT